MQQPHQTREQVTHLISLYHRGIICASEMWVSIADALTPANATTVLDSLTEAAKQQLGEVWLDRPPAAYIRKPGAPPNEQFDAVCVRVVRWCELNGPRLEPPPGPDGLIRVCVEGQAVKEWRPWEKRGHEPV